MSEGEFDLLAAYHKGACDPKRLYLESNLNNSYILYLRRNLSTRPAVSIIFCFPV
jgi:hypothetical protein